MANLNPKRLQILKLGRPISRKLKIFFIILQIVFSYDFGFIKYKSRREKLIFRIGSVVLPIVLRSILIFEVGFDTHLVYMLWQVLICYTFLSFVIILLVTNERNTFCKFLEHLYWIDISLKLNCYPYSLYFKLSLWFLLSFSHKAVSSVIFCTYMNDGPAILYQHIVLTSMFVSLDIPLIILHFVFNSTNIKLKALRKFIQDKKLKPKEAQTLYKYLIDGIEDVQKSLFPIFVVAMTTYIPILMSVIYDTVRHIKNNTANFMVYMANSVSGISIVAVMFASAFEAESLSTEVEKLRVILHDMLIDEEDENRMRDLKRFIKYIDARPFKFRVIKVFPMDATFPVIVLNFCVTYLIVTLQMTHIY